MASQLAREAAKQITDEFYLDMMVGTADDLKANFTDAVERALDVQEMREVLNLLATAVRTSGNCWCQIVSGISVHDATGEHDAQCQRARALYARLQPQGKEK